MVTRGHIYWAELPSPAGRRPVVVLTRDSAIPVLSGIVIAPLTRTVRDIASEVAVGRREGLSERCAINCDNLATIAKDLLSERRIGKLGPAKMRELDRAVRFALGIVF